MTDLATRPEPGSALVALGARAVPRPAGPLDDPPTRPEAGLDDVRTPLDRWLAEQGRLTAVERFSQHHDEGTAHPTGLDGDRPLHPQVWRDLIPLTTPRPGEQYRFEVDLDSCTGCKACVSACHSLNGLDEGESFRSVGTLHGVAEGTGLALVQTVTSACHHCLDPACMAGCPTQAYVKDPVTGIVRHLDDQCIGCSYCTLTCPYEVPRFNERLGIVRKCDLCQDRLAEGEAPACVQGCPTNAITVGIVSVDELARSFEAAIAASDDPDVDIAVVPTAPPSRLTRPTTVYRRGGNGADDRLALGGAALAGAEPADRNAPRPAHAHTPLAVMLVLTQLAAGVAAAGAVLPFVGAVRRGAPGHAAPLAVALSIATALAGLLALGASLLHLGRPRIAWKAVLGLRTSWLSREILAFGAFAGSSVLWATASFRAAVPDEPLSTALGLATAATGVAGVACSALIYAVTGRRWWALWRILPRFLLTTVMLGFAVVIPVAALAAATADDPSVVIGALAIPAARIALLALAAKLASEIVFVFRPHPDSGQLARTARLLTHDLAGPFRMRLATGGAAGVGLLLLSLLPPSAATPRVVLGTMVALVLTVSALLDRWLFFTASSPRRMPGGVP